MNIEQFQEFGITRENIRSITKIVSKKMLKLKELLMGEYGTHLSKKNLSEIVGKLFEKETAVFLTNNTPYNVLNAQSDKDPDLVFSKDGKGILKVEIKVTSTVNTWTGGEFSKRPFDYLLISWGEDFTSYFIAYTHLEKDEWQSNIAKGFYGPSYKVKFLNEKKDKIILLGRINERGTGIVREDIFQTKF